MEMENDEEQQQPSVIDTSEKAENEESWKPSMTDDFSGALDRHSSHKDSSHSTHPTEASSEKRTDSEDDEDKESSSSNWAKYTRGVIFAIAFLIGLVLCCTDKVGDRTISQTLGIAVWISALWLTELVPLVVTALMPLFMFPMFGILSSKDVAGAYVNDTIFLFISGMIMALALERWDLHKRLSFKILSWCGTKPSNLLFGMMTVTFLLSMFVSNTATALMMVPNAISVCDALDRHQSRPELRDETKRFGVAVMLGIAYAANVGGMASLIGTPPNLIFQAQLEVLFPDAPEVTFAEWMFFGLPIGIVVLIFTWVYLRFLYLRNFQGEVADREIFVNEYTALGAWTLEQATVGALFGMLAILWVFRGDLEFSSFTIPGWSNIFPEADYISDATFGMCFAVLLFLIPARPCMLPGATEDADFKRSTTLMDWETANRMPYDIIFLFGGGFALAEAFVSSGLSTYLGDTLGDMQVSLPAQVFLITFVISFVTCLTSNTATSSIMIPIAASIAVGAEVSPYTFMIPTAMACSCAFCLPVATPPNMVVFASGRLPMVEMMRAGVLLNILCAILILGTTFTLIPAILDVPADHLPEWAETTAF